MRKICVINMKGGVGKTTTSLNLAAGLSMSERKVLLLDLDPQSNIELSINLTSSYSISDFLFEGVALSECLNSAGKNFDLLKGDAMLMSGGDLDKAVERLNSIGGYDYLIFDCGPSMGDLNKMALRFCDEAVIPTTTDYLGYEGVSKMITFIKEFSDFNMKTLKVSKIVPTLYDKRNKICNVTLEKMNNEFYEKIANPIRINSKLKEAPANKKSIFTYAKSSSGAEDYWSLVQSVISDEVIMSSKSMAQMAQE